jgi:hypothetical protein
MDRVRESFLLPRDACLPAVLEEIVKTTSAPVRVVLLDRNTETLVHTCASAIGIVCPPKFPPARDSILNRCADADASLRASVLRQCPDFARLVDIVYGWIQAVGSSPG